MSDEIEMVTICEVVVDGTVIAKAQLDRPSYNIAFALRPDLLSIALHALADKIQPPKGTP